MKRQQVGRGARGASTSCSAEPSATRCGPLSHPNPRPGGQRRTCRPGEGSAPCSRRRRSGDASGRSPPAAAVKSAARGELCRPPLPPRDPSPPSGASGSCPPGRLGSAFSAGRARRSRVADGREEAAGRRWRGMLCDRLRSPSPPRLLAHQRRSRSRRECARRARVCARAAAEESEGNGNTRISTGRRRRTARPDDDDGVAADPMSESGELRARLQAPSRPRARTLAPGDGETLLNTADPASTDRRLTVPRAKFLGTVQVSPRDPPHLHHRPSPPAHLLRRDLRGRAGRAPPFDRPVRRAVVPGATHDQGGAGASSTSAVPQDGPRRSARRRRRPRRAPRRISSESVHSSSGAGRAPSPSTAPLRASGRRWRRGPRCGLAGRLRRRASPSASARRASAALHSAPVAAS